MTEVINYIPARLKNAAVGGHVAGAEDIIDDYTGETLNSLSVKPATTGTTGDYPYNGLGRVILRKNMVSGVNTLTQDMFYKGEVGSRVPNTNTVFVVKYDFVLGEDITVPADCVLEFDGGSISGEHTLTGNNTSIQAGLVKVINTDVMLAGTWNVDAVYPQWFGAKGDGVTNDTDAFDAASKVINLNSGGKYIVPKGLYIVGKQTLAGEFGKGYAYVQNDIISITNCQNPVVIEGNGAVLKIQAGLKYGAFNPETGEKMSSQTSGKDYKAHIYSGIITCINCNNVKITNFELNGNDVNLDVGPRTDSTGTECYADGLYLGRNKLTFISNIYTHHHAHDGIYIMDDQVTEDVMRPITIINIVSEYNGRQGMSWTGGNGLLVINSKFNHTAKSVIKSNPKCGVDIEPNNNTICRNGHFIGCEFVDNDDIGFIANSGNSESFTLDDCIFVGTTTYCARPNRPKISFRNCKFYGSVAGVYESNEIKEATRFLDCLFTDDESVYGSLYGERLLASNANNVQFKDCILECQKKMVGFFTSGIVKDCTVNFGTGTTYVGNRKTILSLERASVYNLTINDMIGDDAPEDAYAIYLGTGDSYVKAYGKSRINSTNSKIRWGKYNGGIGTLKANENILLRYENTLNTNECCYGECVFLYDLHIPIWYDGSGWRKADGTVFTPST